MSGATLSFQKNKWVNLITPYSSIKVLTHGPMQMWLPLPMWWNKRTTSFLQDRLGDKMRTGRNCCGYNLLKTTSSNAMHFILPGLPCQHQTAKPRIQLGTSSFPSDTETPNKPSSAGDRFYCELYNHVNVHWRASIARNNFFISSWDYYSRVDLHKAWARVRLKLFILRAWWDHQGVLMVLMIPKVL